MPMPMEYRTAQRDFDAFMVALRDRSGLTFTHQTYTMLEAVFLAFRRRLAPRDVVLFADALPPVLRGLFLTAWDPEQGPCPMGTPQEWIADVKALRPDHNLSPPSSISDVGSALREALGETAFSDLLSRLPEPSRAFWLP